MQGPDRFWGLPGTILELDVVYTKGDSMYEQISYQPVYIDLNPKNEVSLPKRAKPMRESDYRKLIEKRMKIYNEGVDLD